MLQTQLLTSAALFTALTLANPQFNIDTAEATKAATDAENFVISVTANPTFQSDVAVLESALPSSLLADALSNPDALIQDIYAAPTLDASASAALGSLETLAAKPLAAISDVYAYAESIATQPAISSVISVLRTAVPSSVQDALASDPTAFLQDAITQTVEPSWLAALPTDIKSDIGSMLNKGLSIAASDLEAQSTPTGSATAGGKSGMVPVATGGAGGQGGGNGTKPTTGAPAATFKAEGSRGTVAIGCVVLAAVGGVFFGL